MKQSPSVVPWNHPRRLLAWLLPLLAFLAALCFLLNFQQRVGIGLAFLDDQPYQDMALARSMSTHGTFGFTEGQPIPASRDTLWVILLSFTRILAGSIQAAVYVLGAACCAATLWVLRRLCLEIEPSQNYAGFTVLLTAVAPGLVGAVVSGLGAPLAMLLATWAVWLHLRTVDSGVDRLPALAAVMVGLLMWIRIEFLVLWLVFWLHAALVDMLFHGNNRNAFYVLIRGLNGLLLMAMCLFPLVAWNLTLVKVPWPRMVGAPLLMETWGSTSAMDTVVQYFKLVSTSLPHGMAQWFKVGFTQSAVVTVVLLFSAGVVTVLAVTRTAYRRYLIFPCIILGVSALYGLVYPVVGWGSAPVVFEAFIPVLIALTTLGIYRWPYLIRDGFVRRGQSAPERLQLQVAWGILGGLLLLTSGLAHVMLTGEHARELNRKTEARTETRRALVEHGLLESTLGTDEPGWLVYTANRPVIDLSGLATPGVLGYLNHAGQYDAETLDRLHRDAGTTGWVLWNPQFADLSIGGTVPMELPDNRANPRLLAESRFVGPERNP